jgi:cytosine/uracil/thiamine/allantoin permease
LSWAIAATSPVSAGISSFAAAYLNQCPFGNTAATSGTMRIRNAMLVMAFAMVALPLLAAGEHESAFGRAAERAVFATLQRARACRAQKQAH